MMNMIEEAIIYATILHQGRIRKFRGIPYILHPLEVAQIISTMTDDKEIISAGILHDIVEDTDGTLAEIKERFGDRVATIVASESENKYPEETKGKSWERRKEESLLKLQKSTDIGVKMLWLADKLSNIRSLSGIYSEKGEEMWQSLHQKDPQKQLWYYRTVGEMVELSLNKTGAFKEYIKHINFIWPGTFDSEKARYKKYREVSVEGCKLIGRGAKGDVYKYDDELVIKVYNHNNTYHDVEREIALSRQAFILGIPTAISFGIVSVGEQYGAMYELVDSQTLSTYIAKNPSQVESYAKIMAELAHTIHGVPAPDSGIFPSCGERIKSYIRGGIGYEDESLGKKCMKLFDALPETKGLLHGDFHTGNVFMQKGEALLIDMDRISTGHPIVELSDLYYFYVILGEEDPEVIENFMGFSYQTAKKFFDYFLRFYLNTEDENKLNEIKKKASVLCYTRMIRKLKKDGTPSEKDAKLIKKYVAKLEEVLDKVNSLAF